MTEEFANAQALLDAGDVPGLLRQLRGHGEALTLGEVAGLVAGAARIAGFDDLARAAAALAGDADGTGPGTGAGTDSGAQDPAALYDYGYACIERGVEHLAIRPLTRALELLPSSAPVLSELVVALEHEGLHGRAVAVLEEHESILEWFHRFQYVYNALMGGDLDRARAGFGRLPEPAEQAWAPARAKVRHMLARSDTAGAVTALDRTDLRGWHYVLTGGVLASLSPYGFDAGMTGRWAYLGDSLNGCAAALRRLRLILDAAGAGPESVALLPDRSSRILGTAAAALFGLPAAEFDPDKPAPHQLVVAYDLTETDPRAVTALHGRAPGQILFERATCWTAPPRASADVSALLAQHIDPPWGPRMRRLEDGSVGRGPADERPVEVVAEELAGTEPEQDEGDGQTPADTDEELRRFVAAVSGAGERAGSGADDGGWLGGIREYVRDAGPVPSSRFL